MKNIVGQENGYIKYNEVNKKEITSKQPNKLTKVLPGQQCGTGRCPGPHTLASEQLPATFGHCTNTSRVETVSCSRKSQRLMNSQSLMTYFLKFDLL